jgi:hypothetical protein
LAHRKAREKGYLEEDQLTAAESSAQELMEFSLDKEAHERSGWSFAILSTLCRRTLDAQDYLQNFQARAARCGTQLGSESGGVAAAVLGFSQTSKSTATHHHHQHTTHLTTSSTLPTTTTNCHTTTTNVH